MTRNFCMILFSLSLSDTRIFETTIWFVCVTGDGGLFFCTGITNVHVASFNDHSCLSFVSLFCSCKPYI